MTKEFKSATPNMWHWKQASPFSQSVTAGDQVYISGQHTLDENGAVLDCGDIAAQTRNVFENMKLSLAQVGLELSDLVRLNTYYVFEGSDEGATRYWEDMTRVRLEYFPDPGPAATAVRAKGMPYAGQLIQIEGIALRGESRSNRQRIMPDGSWDWSISVPLSQGWKIGDRIFVGGQISADKTGASVHIGDLDAQTRNIYQYIEQVLSEAGSSFKDVVHIKVCFKYDSKDPTSGKDFVDRIMEITEEYIDGPAPVLTAFAVDLLYPGLDLEIDAVAIVDSNRQTLTNTDSIGRYQPSVFSDGVKAKNEIYVAGQTALAEDGTKRETDLGGVFHKIAPKLGRRGLVVIVSDAMGDVDSMARALAQFRASRHEVLFFQIMDPDEIDFPFSGRIQFRDLENVEKQKETLKRIIHTSRM